MPRKQNPSRQKTVLRNPRRGRRAHPEAPGKIPSRLWMEPERFRQIHPAGRLRPRQRCPGMAIRWPLTPDIRPNPMQKRSPSAQALKP